MLPSTHVQQLEKSRVRDSIALPHRSPYNTYYGLNWVSFVSTHPFAVSAASSTPSASVSTPKSASRPRQSSCEDAEVARKSAALVAAQLPRVAVSTSRCALQKALTSNNILHLPANGRITMEKCYTASLWCLHPSTVYTVALTSESPVTGHESYHSGVTEITFQTRDFNLPLDLREESPHIVEHGSLLFHPEFVQCITAQGASALLFYLPTDLLDAHTALPFAHAFWYHGLFTLPESVPISPTCTLLFFLLPNGDERYVLDLTHHEHDRANVAPVEDRRPVHQRPGSPSHGVAEAKDGAKEKVKGLYPWRGQSKVRRAIRSGLYTLVVRNDASGVMASLQRACDYHLSHSGSSWLNPAFIRFMGSCCDEMPAQETVGARLVCIELVNESSAEVVAGCCGMAIGSVYHDYTMYTLHRCKDSLGTFLTKLIGEALQQCGYSLWYWGFRIAYMADYEKHFGAVNMPRSIFYRRWCDARDVKPLCAVETYLRNNKGMVPYTSKVV
ncbi:hypothetical protein ABL78_4977 [Leptomonas seymouri]|uniref:Uncharacterized protein n=1 Tax=Leptomonas seymouri TaxID=5684 RepID=A0A0N1PBI6_LEPSE|nr:hypothetical protein ABL78_4977 [Leptomonas seymouri]|eukprot:KPI85975.1 hypothetical protein ABL78_4977 [Leptomonas seymouri]